MCAAFDDMYLQAVDALQRHNPAAYAAFKGRAICDDVSECLFSQMQSKGCPTVEEAAHRLSQLSVELHKRLDPNRKWPYVHGRKNIFSGFYLETMRWNMPESEDEEEDGGAERRRKKKRDHFPRPVGADEDAPAACCEPPSHAASRCTHHGGDPVARCPSWGQTSAGAPLSPATPRTA